jgi:hypothetical protein
VAATILVASDGGILPPVHQQICGWKPLKTLARPTSKRYLSRNNATAFFKVGKPSDDGNCSQSSRLATCHIGIDLNQAGGNLA